MIQRVFEQAKKCTLLSNVVVATDDKRIFDHVIDFGGNAKMTSIKHSNGTERCNELANEYNSKLIVNIQGDQPFIKEEDICSLIKLFDDKEVKIASLAKKITKKSEIENSNCVKVTFDKETYAINFYREVKRIDAKINYFKHLGIYAYRSDILNELCNLKKTTDEIKNKLEQLRWLDNDFKIKLAITTNDSISIDTKDDLRKIT